MVVAAYKAIEDREADRVKLASRYGMHPKTVTKWRKWYGVEDSKMGPKHPRSTVLAVEEEKAAHLT